MLSREQKEFVIQLESKTDDCRVYKFQVDKTLFEAFDYKNFNDKVDILATINLKRNGTFFEVEIIIEGKIEMLCDVEGKPYDEEIKGKLFLIVKIGDDFSDDGEIVTVPHHYKVLDISHYIYECIILSIPLKRVSKEYSKDIQDTTDGNLSLFGIY